MEILSKSTGTLKQSISTRDDEKYMRPFFQDDSFLDDTQIHSNDCSENLYISHKKVWYVNLCNNQKAHVYHNVLTMINTTFLKVV